MGEEEFRQIEEFCRDGCRLAVLPITRSPSRDVVWPEGLDGAPFLSFSVRQFTDGVFQRSGVVRRLVAEAQYSLALAELVARRLGVALVNPFTPADLAAKGVWLASVSSRTSYLRATGPFAAPHTTSLSLLRAQRRDCKFDRDATAVVWYLIPPEQCFPGR